MEYVTAQISTPGEPVGATGSEIPRLCSGISERPTLALWGIRDSYDFADTPESTKGGKRWRSLRQSMRGFSEHELP